MTARFPLYARILCWFFLNIGLLGAGLYIALRSGKASDWLIMQQADPRLQSVSRLLVQELQPLPPSEWTAVLKKYSAAYDMTFALFSNNGQQVAGDPLELPGKVRARLPDRPPQPQPGERPPFRPGRLQEQPPGNPNSPPFQENPQGPPGGVVPFPRPGGPRFSNPNPPPQPPGQQGQEMSFTKFLVRTEPPGAYWIIVRVPLRPPGGQGGTSLVLMTPSLSAGGLVLDFTPWMYGAAALLLLSSLLWLPLVRGITRSVSRMKKATARIAEGQFDVQVPDHRRDELGELAREINRLAVRLSGFVTGQKRFLGDIAHELCTPLARMQMGAAALEQRAPEELKARVTDLTVEVEAMSLLVSELLDFSRAGLAPQSIAKTSISLLPLVEQVLSREGVPANTFNLHLPEGLTVLANPGLLSRALANVVRNAVRYAGCDARLEIRALSEPGAVILIVADNGPGVPEAAIASLFDPFFRLEAARDRESGGTGLGLAIVKTCVQSFGGTVTARNRNTGGLEIKFTLPTTQS